MKKQYSGKKMILRVFAAMALVTVISLVSCGGYALYTIQQELAFCNDVAMDIYFSDILDSMDNLEQFCNNIYYKDSGFRVLALEPELVTQEQYLQEWRNIRLMVRSRMTDTTGILVFDNRKSDKYYSLGSEFGGGALDLKTVQAMDSVRAYWQEHPDPEEAGWNIIRLDNPKQSVILTQARCYRSIYICAMVDVTAFSDSFEHSLQSSITYSFLTPDQILTNTEYAKSYNISLQHMLSANASGLHFHGMDHVLVTKFDEKSGLGLCGMISTDSMWGSWWIYIAILLLVFFLDCIVFVWIYVYVKRILIYPLHKIQELSRQIAGGAADIIKEPENIKEIAEIQDALEDLLKQKVVLETEKMRQESQKEHAMLQYYQLQTRSHFLLNCLKSLYHLTMKGEHEKTLRLITRFSNHIRYVFHDSLTVVPVSSELEEVDDYFEIIDAERTNPMTLTKNVDPALLNYPIPPLLIQTFVENFHKHNPQSDKALNFTIRMDQVRLEDEEYVRIRMSDNGAGYSEEALQQLQHVNGTFVQFHVGIQNLCRRIEILYKNRHKTAFYNLPNGGACSVFYLPASFASHKEN